MPLMPLLPLASPRPRSTMASSAQWSARGLHYLRHRPVGLSAKQKKQASPSPQAAAIAGFDAGQPISGRRPSASPSPSTNSSGRCKVSGPIVFLRRPTMRAARTVLLLGHRARRPPRAPSAGVFGRQGRAMDRSRAGADRPAPRRSHWPPTPTRSPRPAASGADHRGRGRAYVAVRLKTPPRPSPPAANITIVGRDTISTSPGRRAIAIRPAARLVPAAIGWRAAWADIDIPALMAAASICDGLVGTRAGVYERRCNGVLSLAEARSPSASSPPRPNHWWSGGGSSSVPGRRRCRQRRSPRTTSVATSPSRARGRGGTSSTGCASMNRRQLAADRRAAGQQLRRPGLRRDDLRDLEFPLTTSVSTVQRLMKVEKQRNRRQRTVAFRQPLRPAAAAVEAATLTSTAFPARVTAWSLAAEGGVDLTWRRRTPRVGLEPGGR